MPVYRAACGARVVLCYNFERVPIAGSDAAPLEQLRGRHFAMKTFSSIRDLESLVGCEIGVSDEVVLDQAMIDGFAEVTGDGHWTYVDAERCAHEASHGQTVAHPALLLGLITQLVGKIVAFTANMPTTFSYGFNEIRFPAPARAGQRVRLRLGVARIERFRGGLQSYWSVLMESPDAEELCLSGEWIT